MKKQTYKLWGSGFTDIPDSLMLQFTAGHDVYPILPADEVLITYDIKCNQVHVEMLGQQKIISEEETQKLLSALDELKSLYIQGKFKLNPKLEDVHTNIENWISQNYGNELAGKMHTGRSRNDQVVTDMYLYMHDQIDILVKSIKDLIKAFEISEEKYKYTICPGFTHHQHATVTSFGMILGSYKTAFARDIIGFENLKDKYNQSPLGASTGYGTLIGIDPDFTAKNLGFKEKFKNPIDVISNRGEFEAAFAFQITQFLNHASNFSETIILFSMSEFNFVKLADKYSTGSSAMPQKKNADPIEIIKGLASTSSGILNSLLQLTKNNFIGFNRDSQESKHLIYHLINKAYLVPVILTGVINTMCVFPKQMNKQANKGFINSMGLMELIINKYKLPMRQTKILIEKCIKSTMKSGENNKILYSVFKKTLAEIGLNIDLGKEEFIQWQDAEFQFKLLIKNLKN